MTDLSPMEFRRYNRHIIIPEIGLAGQKRLKESSVLLVGAGGLGSPVALYLAAAGVGRMGIIDGDRVDESNLQRQVLHGTSMLGRAKVESARERLLDLNPNLTLEIYNERLANSNALELFRSYDLIVDGSDNYPTRYRINDAAVLAGRPFIYGSIYRFEGQLSVFHYKGGPCYRCLYHTPPPPELVTTCEQGGVLGVLPGVVGTLQANEAIKVLLGMEHVASGRLILYDAFRLKFRELKIRKDPNCPICSSSPSITELQDYEGFCGETGRKEPGEGEGNLNTNEHNIAPRDLIERIVQGSSPLILDLRDEIDRELDPVPHSVPFPEREMQRRMEELDPGQEYVILCRSGITSDRVARLLRANGFARVKNLPGGMDRFLREMESRHQR